MIIGTEGDVHLQPNEYGISKFGDPSISIFDTTCRLVWYQYFPSFGEVGFKFVTLLDQQGIFISAITVFEPADLFVHYEEILSFNGVGIGSLLTFGGTESSAAYVGSLGPSDDYSVVIKNYRSQSVGGRETTAGIPAIAYHLKRLKDPLKSKLTLVSLFFGPELLDANKLSTLKLPAKPAHPPYPWVRYVFGNDD